MLIGSTGPEITILLVIASSEMKSQFVRDRLVKKGEIDNWVHGRWTVTAKGYQRVGMKKP